MFELILTPAEGRNYDTPEACRADWEGGIAFRILDGHTCSVHHSTLIQRAGFNRVTFTASCGKLLLRVWLDDHQSAPA